MIFHNCLKCLCDKSKSMYENGLFIFYMNQKPEGNIVVGAV